MDEELELALCIIKVLCLLVITVSVYRISCNVGYYSYMTSNPTIGAVTGGAGLRHSVASDQIGLGIRSGFTGDGGYERTFNIPVSDIQSLETSSGYGDAVNNDDSDSAASAVANRLNNNMYYGTESQKTMARNADLAFAARSGVVQGPGGRWNVSSFVSGFKGGKKNFNNLSPY